MYFDEKITVFSDKNSVGARFRSFFAEKPKKMRSDTLPEAKTDDKYIVNTENFSSSSYLARLWLSFKKKKSKKKMMSKKILHILYFETILGHEKGVEGGRCLRKFCSPIDSLSNGIRGLTVYLIVF